MKKSNSFTLVELLLVIALIAITVTVTSLGISKLLFSEHFEKDVSRLQNVFSLAETLMCADTTDVTVSCSITAQGLCCYLSTPSFHQTSTFKHIHELCFNQRPTPFSLTFRSSLCQPPQGNLEIKGKLCSYFLQFPGYPGGLVLSRSPQPLGIEHAAPYPQELLSAT